MATVPNVLATRYAADAKRLPSVVAWAGTLCERPTSTSDSYCAARAARRASAATIRSRTSSSDRRICSCSTFSVRSRLVSPLWTCS